VPHITAHEHTRAHAKRCQGASKVFLNSNWKVSPNPDVTAFSETCRASHHTARDAQHTIMIKLKVMQSAGRLCVSHMLPAHLYATTDAAVALEAALRLFGQLQCVIRRWDREPTAGTTDRYMRCVTCLSRPDSQSVCSNSDQCLCHSAVRRTMLACYS